MRPRDPDEDHRVATPLELLTDLCFVVAVSQAGSTLHHAVSENHIGEGLLGYVFAFFAIWWTWLNFTWFASAYDNDDLGYRLLTILQILGSLVLAVGVPNLFEDNTVAVVGYVIMRIALVLQWLRAARHDPPRRITCRRYALGIGVVQLFWVGSVFVPHAARLEVFIVLIAAEFAVSPIAERAGSTSWHPHHIAERYSLFFIIVLGETILSTAEAIQRAVTAPDTEFVGLGTLVAGGVLIVFSIWWLYFSRPAAVLLRRAGSGLASYVWGFGHYVIFAAAAAIGAALSARVEFRIGESKASGFGSAAVLTVPVAVLLAAIWFLQLRRHDSSLRTVGPFGLAIPAVLASTFSPFPELIVGLVCALLLAVEIRVAGLAPGEQE